MTVPLVFSRYLKKIQTARMRTGTSLTKMMKMGNRKSFKHLLGKIRSITFHDILSLKLCSSKGNYFLMIYK